MRGFLLSLAWWYLLFGPSVPVRPASGPVMWVEEEYCGESGCAPTQRVWRRVEVAGPFENRAICEAVRDTEADEAGWNDVQVTSCIFSSAGKQPTGHPQRYFRDGTAVVVPIPRFP